MKKIIKKDLPFVRQKTSIREAEKIFAGNPYKMAWLREIKASGKEAIIYKTGDEFVDLCAGPHLKSTGEIGAFKLLSVAGAYWRGDEKNKMLTRIYGTAYFNQKELKLHLERLKEAEKRDHRKLNKTLKLYFLSDELGHGLVTLLPNGAIIARELENWAEETERKLGYLRVLTPHIASEKLFIKTGHVPHYSSHMYPPMNMKEKGEDEVYYLKPMNCAGHHLVFKSEPRSYRDLPLKIAEYGAVYRYEQSGELHGIMRVRGPIHQNDAHIFCTQEQAKEEFAKVMDLHQYYYNVLGMTKKDYFLSLATRDKANKGKYLGEEKMWQKAEKVTLSFVSKTKLPYEIEEGGAAFYGPKIDFNIKTVTGKVFSASTNQVDFFIPKSLGLKYTDKDGREKTPVCIHRAPLGAHVRFIAFLTEHFAGAFPVWLAPLQVKILPITDKQLESANKVNRRLEERQIRTRVDGSSQTLSYRIRQAQVEKVPFILIIGKKEAKNNSVTVRQRNGKEFKEMNLANFIEAVEKLIKDKSLSLLEGIELKA